MTTDNHFIKDETEIGLVERTNFQSFESSFSDDEPINNDGYLSQEEDLEDDSVPLSRNPYLRIGIGGAFFMGVITFVLFLNGGSETQVVEEVENAETSELTLGEDNSEVFSQSQAEEIDKLNSELALLDQAQRLAEIDRNNEIETVPTEELESSEDSAVSSPAPPTRPVSAVRTTAPPVPRPAPRQAAPPRPAPRPVASVRPTPSAAPRPAPRASVPVRPAPISTPAAPPPPSLPVAEPIDPQTAWLSASNAGIFGHMPAMEPIEEVSAVPVTAAQQPQYHLQNAVSFELEKPVQDPYYATAPSTKSNTRTRNIPGLNYPVVSIVPMGQKASATVTTPITWLGEGNQYMIALNEDVLDASGRVAIPADSSVVVQPVSVDESSGYAELAAVGLMMNGDVIPVDYQTVSIHGEGGNPLIAQRYGDIGGDIAANDVEMFAIGALGGIGQILTRPDSQVVTNGAFGSSSSTDYGDRNILGAVLDGGSQQLVGRMGDRNQSRLDELRSRDAIFYLAEGTPVQFYVNTSFSL